MVLTFCSLALRSLVVNSLLESIMVTAIFVHLGTISIAVTTLLTVVVYFVFTYLFTNWKYVALFNSPTISNLDIEAPNYSLSN